MKKYEATPYFRVDSEAKTNELYLRQTKDGEYIKLSEVVELIYNNTSIGLKEGILTKQQANKLIEKIKEN